MIEYTVDKDGNSYTGGYVNGHEHGEGLMTYSDGSKYKGAFVEGKRQG